MQCPLCKRWYGYAVEDPLQPQWFGCGITVSTDGQMLWGSYGSVTLDGSRALITKPGSLAPDTLICDWCFLQGEKLGDYVMQGDAARWPDDPPMVIPLAFRDGSRFQVLFCEPDYVILLCTFEERWVLRVGRGVWSAKMHVECLGYPERSDVDKDEILTHPGVVALRDFIGEVITKENT
jgi:hypothetical protein